MISGHLPSLDRCVKVKVMSKSTQVAVFGGGCFWCTEAVLKQLRGVVAVMPGYAGGDTQNPSYYDVAKGVSGHAEVVRIEFNPEEISYKTLLTVFFASHDPTTLNRQGADVGSQYRSIILYTSDEQKQQAEEYIRELNESEEMGDPIVTEVKPMGEFYEAEEEHKDFAARNPNQPYVQAVINPKLEKVRKRFADLIFKQL